MSTIGKWLLASAVLVAGTFTGASHAFGLKTHLWIAEDIIADLKDNCVIKLKTVGDDDLAVADVALDQVLCDSINWNKKAFRSGALGPDAYPDLITGQLTAHPGVEGSWQTADWLEHMFLHAKEGAELAFAAGYLVHAASDVFAHTYVNAYSGDVFSLLDGDSRVEARHFVLEKYIDSRLPHFEYSRENVRAPIAFVRERLIHNKDAAQAAKKQFFARHIVFMASAWSLVDELEASIRALQANERDMNREIERRRDSVQQDLSVANRRLNTMTALHRLASPANYGATAAELRIAEQNVASLQESLKEAMRAPDELAKVLKHSKALAKAVTMWRESMDRAAAHYIEASESVVDGAIVGDNRISKEYTEWLSCHAPAYRGIPAGISETKCSTIATIKEMEDDLKLAVADLLPVNLGRIYRTYLSNVDELKKSIRARSKKAALDLAILVAPKRNGTEQFIKLITSRTNPNRDALNKAFNSVSEPGQRPLFSIPDVASLIDSDMALVDGKLQPDVFKPLYNARVLSRVALLDIEGLRSLARQLGADDREVNAPKKPGRHSILYEMVRSIDGNHQWQPYGLPYPMHDGQALYSARGGNAFGYGPRDEEAGRAGLSLFVKKDLRERVFNRMFKGQMHKNLMEKLGTSALPYPYPECAAHPFAIAFDAQGEHVDHDCSCGACTTSQPAE